MKKSLSLTLGALSLAGLAAALWAHAVSMGGVDPMLRFPRLWLFQLLLFSLLVPLIVRVLRRGWGGDPLGLPRRTHRPLYALLLYYGFHFYLFLWIAPDGIRPSMTWRMFSAGWMVLFALTAAFYWTRFAE